MSTVEAKRVRIVRANESIVRTYLHDTAGMDEFEVSDYMSNCDLLLVDDELWKYELVEDLDANGFVEVLEDSGDSKDMIALWYNGGASLDEIVTATFKHTGG